MIAPLLFALILIYIAIVDARTRLIRHYITVPATAAALAFSMRLPAGGWLNALLGACAAGCLFGAIWWLANRTLGKGAFGFGDVMLAILIGAIGGVYAGLAALAAGMLVAGVAAGLGLAWGKVKRGDTLPYGTCLVIGALSVLPFF